jgi:hypothetical protein
MVTVSRFVMDGIEAESALLRGDDAIAVVADAILL